MFDSVCVVVCNERRNIYMIEFLTCRNIKIPGVAMSSTYKLLAQENLRFFSITIGGEDSIRVVLEHKERYCYQDMATTFRVGSLNSYRPKDQIPQQGLR